MMTNDDTSNVVKLEQTVDSRTKLLSSSDSSTRLSDTDQSDTMEGDCSNIDNSSPLRSPTMRSRTSRQSRTMLTDSLGMFDDTPPPSPTNSRPSHFRKSRCERNLSPDGRHACSSPARGNYISV